jgi:hypothetical protein
MSRMSGLVVQPVTKWSYRNVLYRVRSLCYVDGSEGLVIEVFGPGAGQRSAVVRGDVASVAPLGGWRWSSDEQRSEVVEALFDPCRWG